MIESVEGRKEGYESDVDEGNNDLDFPGNFLIPDFCGFL